MPRETCYEYDDQPSRDEHFLELKRLLPDVTHHVSKYSKVTLEGTVYGIKITNHGSE